MVEVSGIGFEAAGAQVSWVCQKLIAPLMSELLT